MEVPHCEIPGTGHDVCVRYAHSSSARAVAKAPNSPRARTPAQTGRRHRLPRAREPSYAEPQDCSDDSAAGQCARLTHHLLPGRFRGLPVERPGSRSDFDASRPDTADHLGPLSPRPTGCASASRDSAGGLRTANRVLNDFQSGSLRSCRERSVKPLDNLRRFVEHRPRTPAWRASHTGQADTGTI